jgi:hypothetical protein
MDARQKAKFNMRRAVEQHLDENTEIIAAVPAFPTALGKLKTFNTRIAAAAGLQETPRTGVAKDKQTRKDELIENALKVIKPARAHASEVGDNTLRDEVDYAFTDLNRLRDEQLAPRCQVIHDRAAALLEEMKAFGLTSAKLAALQTAIDDYSAETPKPRAARAETSVQTDNLEDLFSESKKVLIQMDDMIDNFKDDHPDFVAKYKKLREIDEPPSRPRKTKDTEDENGDDKTA